MYEKLYSNPQSVYSDIFLVPSGKVVYLLAEGLQSEKYRDDPAQFGVEQMFCIRRILHEYTAKANKNTCGFIVTPDDFFAEEVADTLVSTCALPWQLTKCRNMGIIGVPGAYRLELNDTTVLGEVQAYALQADVSSCPLQLESLFFK